MCSVMFRVLRPPIPAPPCAPHRRPVAQDQNPDQDPQVQPEGKHSTVVITWAPDFHGDTRAITKRNVFYELVQLGFLSLLVACHTMQIRGSQLLSPRVE
jgi:hypothetical protein